MFYSLFIRTVFQCYLIIVSCLLFRQIRNGNAGTRYDHGGVVHRSSEKLATVSPANVEAGVITPGQESLLLCNTKRNTQS